MKLKSEAYAHERFLLQVSADLQRDKEVLNPPATKKTTLAS